MNTIFVYRANPNNELAAAIALAEDGEELAAHVSSNLSFFRFDMGLNGDVGMGREKHAKYKAKYPDGYKLVEVIGPVALSAHIDAGRLAARAAGGGDE